MLCYIDVILVILATAILSKVHFSSEFCLLPLKIYRLGAREVAQWLRAFTGLAEDQGFVPSTQVGWLKTACNSISGHLMPSSCLLGGYVLVHGLATAGL